MTQFSVPTTSGTVSVIRRDAKRNTSGLTAPGSLNTCPMCEGQRWIFNVPTMLLWYTRPPSLGLDPKDPAILGLKAFCQFDAAGTRSANHTIDSPSLFQLRHPDTSRIHYIKTLQILWLTKYALYNRSKTMKLLTYNTLLCTPILEYTLEFWDHSSKQLESLVEVVQHEAVKLFSRNLKEIFRLLKI